MAGPCAKQCLFGPGGVTPLNSIALSHSARGTAKH